MLRRRIISIFLVVVLAVLLNKFLGVPWLIQAFAVTPESPFVVSLVKNAVVASVLVASSLWIAVALHEIGHAIAGALSGFKARVFTVGSLTWEWTGTRWRFELVPKMLMGGSYHGTPQDMRNLAPRFALMAAGGIIVNLCIAGLAVASLKTLSLNSSTTTFWIVFLTCLFFVNTYLACFNLIPARTSGNVKNDGLELWRIARGDLGVPRDMASLMLLSRARSGIKPRDWELRLIETANALEDDSGEFATARFIRFAYLMDRGETQAAGVALDEAMTRTRHVNEVNRPNIWLEHANFLALHRNQPEAARCSFDEAAKYPVRPMFRLRAEAAIAFAERDYPRAVEKANAALEDFKCWGKPVFALDDAEELRALMARAAASGASAV